MCTSPCRLPAPGIDVELCTRRVAECAQHYQHPRTFLINGDQSLFVGVEQVLDAQPSSLGM